MLRVSIPRLLVAWLIVASSACSNHSENTPGGTPTRTTNSSDPAVPERDGPAPAMPRPRAGADLIGRNVIELLPEHWVGQRFDLASNEATLIRFWTDSCPFCATSLPAVETLRKRYGPRGLATLGVYHPKPPRPVSDDEIRNAATRLGYQGPIAVDAEWKSLRSIWLETGQREATSFSILCDRQGVVRFVHPGPEFAPSEDPAHAQRARDFADLEAAIQVLLDA